MALRPQRTPRRTSYYRGSMLQNYAEGRKVLGFGAGNYPAISSGEMTSTARTVFRKSHGYKVGEQILVRCSQYPDRFAIVTKITERRQIDDLTGNDLKKLTPDQRTHEGLRISLSNHAREDISLLPVVIIDFEYED